MLPAKPTPYHVVLNRVTFGARDVDVQAVQSSGIEAWVNEQLNPPAGDDPDLDAFLKSQTMHIAYAASNPATTQPPGWPAVNEDRPLNYIYADTPTLWNVATKVGSVFSFSERFRIRQELAAATWIRNTHSRYQLREFMADFWHNHFNIGKNENELATALLPIYDREAIRPHVFGNFRQILGANATSSSMLIYLDNWVSTATTPNENYAREIMELHTLSDAAYLGTADPASVAKGSNGVAVGFTDQDVIQASRALSGWTVKVGQRFGNIVQPSTGEFLYNAPQHNTQAGTILGVDVSALTAPMAQGEKLLDVIAAHPATATFVCTKLCNRIFGDAPPQEVLDRAVSVWNQYLAAPDQIARVLRTILLDGDEIWSVPAAKVRRPYERLIALLRTTDTVVNAHPLMSSVFDSLNDTLFAWPAPDGRPDTNAYWLATGANIATWNLLLQVPYLPEIVTSLAAQTPESATSSATALVDYWVGRLVGYQLSAAAMNTLVIDQAGAVGVLNALKTNNAATIESAYRRLVSLIATTEEFTLRSEISHEYFPTQTARERFCRGRFCNHRPGPAGLPCCRSRALDGHFGRIISTRGV